MRVPNRPARRNADAYAPIPTTTRARPQRDSGADIELDEDEVAELEAARSKRRLAADARDAEQRTQRRIANAERQKPTIREDDTSDGIRRVARSMRPERAAAAPAPRERARRAPAAVEGEPLTVTFARDKVTPGALRFAELDARGKPVQRTADAVIGSIYLRKDAIGDDWEAWESITVTVQRT